MSLDEGDLVDGRYRLGPIIGRGATGTVHRARHEGLARDVAIKASPSTLPSSVMAFQGMIVFSMSGVILLALDRAPVIPDATNWTMLGLASLFGVGGYFAIITAIRIGDVALVSPFRYTRMLFALLIGIVVFRERPDMLTYLGAAIVVSSGLYTLYREQKLRRALRIAAAS